MRILLIFFFAFISINCFSQMSNYSSEISLQEKVKLSYPLLKDSSKSNSISPGDHLIRFTNMYYTGLTLYLVGPTIAIYGAQLKKIH